MRELGQIAANREDNKVEQVIEEYRELLSQVLLDTPLLRSSR